MTPQSGFTLVETLVAITVLLLVIIGPITVAQKGIQSAYYANEQVTAVFLAQEAIEAMRDLRDSAALVAYNTEPGGDTWDWASDLNSACSDASGCAYDVESDTFESCTSPENNNCKLRIDSAGKYTYGAGSDSPFTRKVYVKDLDADKMSITVEVTWFTSIFGGGNTKLLKLETWLYDHYRRYED